MSNKDNRSAGDHHVSRDLYVVRNAYITKLLAILESGVDPEHYSYFQGSDQDGNLTYNLPPNFPPSSHENPIYYLKAIPNTEVPIPGIYDLTWKENPWGEVLDDYFYLPGRSGGQIAYGGIEEADILTLMATTDNTGIVAAIPLNLGKAELYPGTDNTLDIGDSTHNIKDIYLEGKIYKGSNIFLNTFATENTLLGIGAGNTTMTGDYNLAVGCVCLLKNTSGEGNTAVGGDAALYNNTEGVYNAAFGCNTLQYNTTGDHNTAIGAAALQGYEESPQLTGSENTAVGYSAGSAISGDNANNVYIGSMAGFQNVGSGNVFIGYTSGDNETTGSNKLYIANTITPLIYGEFDNKLVNINGILGVLEGGANPSKYTKFQGGDQSADILYTLPTALPAGNGYYLRCNADGTLYWSAT